MTAPGVPPAEPGRSESNTSLLRAAIWVAIGALIAAAIVCVVWVFVGSQSGIIGRAFLTILLLVAFAGVAILDAHLAPKRPAWFALASMAGWILILLVGAIMIWLPERGFFYSGIGRLFAFLVVVLIVQLALLHARLYVKASRRYVTTFTKIVTIVTIALVLALVALLILPLVFGEYIDFQDLYWRIVVAVTILAAVGTALIPLVNALFAPRKVRPAAPAHPYVPVAPEAGAPLPWPNYVDGVTPLPIMPDGSPDWGAYYSGHPSPGAQVVGAPAPHEEWQADVVTALESGDDAVAAAEESEARPPAHPGYDGYPPPPPLPPRP